MCVSKIKEIHARVTKFCSGNEMRTSGRGTDGRPDRRTSEAGDKNDTKVSRTVISTWSDRYQDHVM